MRFPETTFDVDTSEVICERVTEEHPGSRISGPREPFSVSFGVFNGCVCGPSHHSACADLDRTLQNPPRRSDTLRGQAVLKRDYRRRRRTGGILDHVSREGTAAERLPGRRAAREREGSAATVYCDGANTGGGVAAESGIDDRCTAACSTPSVAHLAIPRRHRFSSSSPAHLLEMVGLLDLPPELLGPILEFACDAAPSLATSTAPLVLTHRCLAPLAVPILWRNVTVRDTAQIERLLHSRAFPTRARLIRSLAFIPRDVDGSARGGVGRGIGTSDTVDGQAAMELLAALKDEWRERQQRGGPAEGIRSLDIASVGWLGPDVLEGEWLSSALSYLPFAQDNDGLTSLPADLRELVVGVSLRLPTSRTLPFTFSFRLESLTLHNNHWESLPHDLLTAILRTGRPAAPGQGLKHLDLSATYDVTGLSRTLSQRLARKAENDEANGHVVISGLTSLRLPPLETQDHHGFALAILVFCMPNLVGEPKGACPRQKLRYLELPPLAAATSGAYDALWAVVCDLSLGSAASTRAGEKSDGLEEVALRGWATGSLVETAKAVLAAAGLDGGNSPMRTTSLKRLRFTRLLAPEELGKLPGPGGKEVLELADQAGVEVVCGPRLDYPLQ